MLPQTRGYQYVSSVSEHQGFVNAVYRGILRCVAEVCACARLHRFSLWKPFVDLIGPYKGLPMCIRFFRDGESSRAAAAAAMQLRARAVLRLSFRLELLATCLPGSCDLRAGL